MSEYWPQILLTIGGIATAVAAAWGGIRQVRITQTKDPVDRDSVAVASALDSIAAANDVREMIRAELDGVRAELTEVRKRLGRLEQRMTSLVSRLHHLAARYMTAAAPLPGSVVAQDIHDLLDQHTDA